MDTKLVSPYRLCVCATRAAMILGLGLLLPACQSFTGGVNTETSAATTASAVQHPMLEGIPVPAGFTFVPEGSVGRSSGKFRVVNYEYQGEMKPTALVRWYKEYMPSAGFTLRQERVERGMYSLRFDSEAEECNIRIAREKLSQTILTIDLGPLPKGSAEREVEPPSSRS
ncbi:MAG: hypothetical protein KKB50_13975 [Planctomycetes bacterium]|nr:hypothetical protein [Planctomycetota bacterium]